MKSKQNFKFIDRFNLFEGKVLRLICRYKGFKKGDTFTISHIHKLYGWILFKETEQLPQEVEELLKITDIKYNLGCGRMFKRVNTKQTEVFKNNNCDFICGVANAWGTETFCFSCEFLIKGGAK